MQCCAQFSREEGDGLHPASWGKDGRRPKTAIKNGCSQSKLVEVAEANDRGARRSFGDRECERRGLLASTTVKTECGASTRRNERVVESKSSAN